MDPRFLLSSRSISSPLALAFALFSVPTAALVSSCGDDDGGDAGLDAGNTDSGASDAAQPDGGATRCGIDADCDDAVYCNGQEVCSPTNTRADAFGCVAGDNPCIDGLICTVEMDPACNESTRACNDVTYDHSACPGGGYCLAFLGCTMVDPCPMDGSTCPNDGSEPCRAPTCDMTLDPPLCVPTNIADDTVCTEVATGTMGICRRGRCCTDC